MKKIVALVLSLVMALSLCTVAFAEVKDVAYGVDENKNVNTDVVNSATFTQVKAHAEKNGKGNVAYYEAEWDATSAGPESYWIPCAQDDADFAIYKNGSFVTWVYETFDKTEANYDMVATAQKATSAKPNCTTTQFFEDGYVDANGCCFFIDYVAGTKMVKLNVDGKIVKATEKTDDVNFVVWASHIFAKGVKNDKTGYDVADCLICKGEFACTSNEAVATKNGYKYSTGFEYSTFDAGNVYDENAYDNGYDFAWGQTYAGSYKFCWQLKAGTTEEIGTAAADTTTGVESAKTFDAGIAMYVGMSLMSVAGTAVVIGKKKEF